MPITFYWYTKYFSKAAKSNDIKFISVLIIFKPYVSNHI